MSETLGFIGLGDLGQPIACNLLAAGYALKIYNRTASKAEPLIAFSVKITRECIYYSGAYYSTAS